MQPHNHHRQKKKKSRKISFFTNDHTIYVPGRWWQPILEQPSFARHHCTEYSNHRNYIARNPLEPRMRVLLRVKTLPITSTEVVILAECPCLLFAMHVYEPESTPFWTDNTDSTPNCKSVFCLRSSGNSFPSILIHGKLEIDTLFECA